jgi:hypothetical protein
MQGTASNPPPVVEVAAATSPTASTVHEAEIDVQIMQSEQGLMIAQLFESGAISVEERDTMVSSNQSASYERSVL